VARRCTYYLRRPDGTTMYSCTYCTSSSVRWEQVIAPTTGTYTVLIDPLQAAIGSATLQVVNSEVTATATVGGAPVTVSTTAAGQTIVVSFNAVAGQNVAVQLSGLNFGGSYAHYYLRRPDGTTMNSYSYYTGSNLSWNITAPVSGAYTVLIDPSGAATGSATVQVT
jgi:hypothetical protein